MDIEVDVTGQDSASVNHLKLRIVPPDQKSSDDVFGIAFLSAEGTGAHGDVFYDSVEELEYELGHLLLGSNAHSRLEIMRPS